MKIGKNLKVSIGDVNKLQEVYHNVFGRSVKTKLDKNTLGLRKEIGLEFILQHPVLKDGIPLEININRAYLDYMP